MYYHLPLSTYCDLVITPIIPLNLPLPKSSVYFKLLKPMVSICSLFTCIWHSCLFSPSWNSLFLSLRLGFFDFPLSCSVFVSYFPIFFVASSLPSTEVFLKLLSWASSSSHSSHAVSAISFSSDHAQIYISTYAFSLLRSIATNLFAYWVFLSGEPYFKCSCFTLNSLIYLSSRLHEKHDHSSLGWPHNISTKPGQFWEKELH